MKTPLGISDVSIQIIKYILNAIPCTPVMACQQTSEFSKKRDESRPILAKMAATRLLNSPFGAW